MAARLAVGILWLLHFFPARALAAFGSAFGMLFYVFGGERRRVGRSNLKLCFPAMAQKDRERLLRRHYRCFGRSFFERAILWWSPREAIVELVRLEGEEEWRSRAGQPLILLAPHFVGLDIGWSRLTIESRLSSMYSNQKDPYINAMLRTGRTRFNSPLLLSRQDGMRAIVKAMRGEGLAFYYLPDMDYGARDAVFVPFFGVQAATITGVSRLARLTGAKVLPCVARQLPCGYALRIYPAWENFPSEDLRADTRRMNAFIEERVREMPEQYFWLHKRFKTRPPGEEKPYP